MPKRRTTRKNSTKPVENIENKAATNEHPDREEQKKMILSEFDANVNAALKDIQKLKSSSESALHKHFQACITAIPLEIRHLTLKDFAACGGTFEKALESVKKTHRNNRLAEIQALKCTVADLGLTECEEEKEKQMGGITDLGTVQRTIKGRKGRARLLKTPAITPKFNPNLPATPENIRGMKPGERLMSLAGTPVRTVRRQQIEENLRECGVELTPQKVDKILQSIASAINLE